MRFYRTTLARLLLLATGVLVACQMTISMEGWGVKGELDVTIDGNNATVPKTPNDEPVMICFYDDQGHLLGGGVAEPGTTLPIPPGTASAKAKRIVDPDDAAGPAGPAGPAGKVRRITPWDIVKFAVDPDLARGVSEYSMTVWARDVDAAEAMADAIEEAFRTGGELPGGVYEVHYATYSILQGTEVAFFFADDRSFSRLDVTLNGLLVSTLDEMTIRSRPGLHVASFQLPLSQFDVGAVPGVTYRNTYEFAAENDHDPATRAGRRGTVEYTL